MKGKENNHDDPKLSYSVKLAVAMSDFTNSASIFSGLSKLILTLKLYISDMIWVDHSLSFQATTRLNIKNRKLQLNAK